MSFQPHIYTLFAALVVLLFAFKGYRRGLVRESITILSLLGAFILTKPLGSLVQTTVTMEGILPLMRPYVAMSAGAFLGYLLMAITLTILAHVLRLHREWSKRTRRILNWSGAALGGLFGSMIILVVSWYILSVGELADRMVQLVEERKSDGIVLSQKQELLLFPVHAFQSLKMGLSDSFLGFIAEKSNPVPDDALKPLEMIMQFASDPESIQEMMTPEAMELLLQEEALRNLLSDEEVIKSAQEGDVLKLLSNPAVQEALQDPELQKALESVVSTN